MTGTASLVGQEFASVAGQVAHTAEGLLATTLKVIFGHEPFIPLQNNRRTHEKTGKPLPRAEMLARHPDGTSAGGIYDKGRPLGHDVIVEMDLITLRRAIGAQLLLGMPVSINLSAETFFSDKLVATLRQIQDEYPELDPAYICLEMTEQGGIPANFDSNKLLELKEMGYTLALDDFDPRKAIEQIRFLKCVPYVDIVKFPHELVEFVRDGTLVEPLRSTIQVTKKDYPHITFVMEGIQETDQDILPVLKEIGIDLVQVTTHRDAPKPAAQNVASAPHP